MWFAVFNSVDCRQFRYFVYYLHIEYRWKGGSLVFCVCVTRSLSPVSLKETTPWHKCPLHLNKDYTGVHFEYMDLFCYMIQTYLSFESSEVGTYLIEKGWVSTWESMMHSLKVICFSSVEFVLDSSFTVVVQALFVVEYLQEGCIPVLPGSGATCCCGLWNVTLGMCCMWWPKSVSLSVYPTLFLPCLRAVIGNLQPLANLPPRQWRHWIGLLPWKVSQSFCCPWLG